MRLCVDLFFKNGFIKEKECLGDDTSSGWFHLLIRHKKNVNILNKSSLFPDRILKAHLLNIL
jgi:hypothetical protein